MHTAFLAIIRGTAGTVHHNPITELVCSGYAYDVQFHVVLLASPLLDDMHECSVTLTLLQASKLLATMSCCKTAALPAMLSCTHVLPHCLTPYTPEEHQDCSGSAASIMHCKQGTHLAERCKPAC